jgi:hypothetical protein
MRDDPPESALGSIEERKRVQKPAPGAKLIGTLPRGILNNVEREADPAAQADLRMLADNPNIQLIPAVDAQGNEIPNRDSVYLKPTPPKEDF